ncbi:hypothetical protein ABTM48_21425, partial [Acinetobacter baumannii]
GHRLEGSELPARSPAHAARDPWAVAGKLARVSAPDFQRPLRAAGDPGRGSGQRTVPSPRRRLWPVNGPGRVPRPFRT